MQNEIPITKKVYDLYRELYQIIEKMPKKDKYTLGARIESRTLDLLELLIAAGYCAKETKLAYLNKSSVKLDLLKILVRLAEEIKSIPTNKYLQTEEKLVEIGRMLGGWIRSTKAP